MRWAGHVARMAEKRKTCKLVAIRLEAKRLILNLSERCENDINYGFQTFDGKYSLD
jgi:hypothetical protein